MSLNPALQPLLVGLLCGGVAGVAASLSRRLLTFAFAAATVLIVLVLVQRGPQGLEYEVGRLVEDIVRNRELVIGAVLGFVLAASIHNRKGS